MKKNHTAAAIVAALLAGCGGGGEESSLSASPPASAGGSPTPAPIVAPGPVSANPAPGKTPTPPPAAPPPASAPPGAGTPPPSISGNVLALAIGQRFIPTETQLAIGKIQNIVNAANSDATHTQEHHFPLPQQTEGRYLSRSMGWQNPNVGYTNPVSVALSLPWTPFGLGAEYGMELGAEMAMNGLTLYRAGAYRVEPGDVVYLDRTVAEWVAAPWFAKLIVQSGDDPALFRVCWNSFTLETKRHACGLFDRATGEHRGVRITDDNASTNAGAVTWVSQ